MNPPYKSIDFKTSPKCTLNQEDDNEILTPRLKEFHRILVGCNSRKLADWDVSQIKDFAGLFEDYPKDIPEGIANWDVSNVITMRNLFKNCKGKIPNLNKWNTSKVKDMSWTFSGCNIRTTKGLCDSWDLKSVELLCGTFAYCVILDTFNCKWNTSQVIYMNNLFDGCTCLRNFCPWFNTENVEDMSHMFQGCSSLVNLKLPFKTKYVNSMAHMFDSCHLIEKIDMTTFDTSNVLRFSYMFAHCGRLKEIYTGKTFNDESGFDMEGMFLNCSQLSIPPVSRFTILNAFSTARMFEGCESVVYLFLENTTMLQVRTMNSMFRNCFSLVKLPIGKWNTSCVQEASCLFYGCRSLIELDCRHIDTANMTDLSYMFADCKKLSKIDISNFDLRNAKNMAGMFEDCISLTSLDLRHPNQLGFDSAEYLAFMFAGCISLSTIKTRLNVVPNNQYSVLNLTTECMNMMAGLEIEQAPLPPVVIRPRVIENNESNENNEEDSEIDELWKEIEKNSKK